jgi:NADPH:quinone reductase-like Zn-dependent oxidoreductase
MAGAEDPAIAARAAEELFNPDPDREIFLAPDDRLVFRIQRGAAERSIGPTHPDHGLTLVSRQGTGHAGLAWLGRPRPPLEAGQVEIAVSATGLNFRDVMWNLRLLPEEALEDGYAGPGLGMECAGTVSRVGPEVDSVAPGDPVVAFAPAAFASHVTAPVFAVSPLPQGLTPAAASTVPVAFLTAYYSLVHLGRLEAGQSVLIHGGAGAVGMAAIQIARQRGATVIATAGSEEKRAFLRAYGVDLVCNSRALSFADEIATYTQGRGVSC